MNYAVEQRLRLIDFLLCQYGTLNISAIMDYFGVSKPCASGDIRDYIAMAPENLTYDGSAKMYVRGVGFNRKYP